MTKQRHVREGDRLDDDEAIVIRGGRLDSEVLRADAQQYHAIYGDYGLSVLAVRGISVDELAQQVPLARFDVLTLIRVGVLRAAGFRLDPTGRNPEALHCGVRRPRPRCRCARPCEHHIWANPYHEG